MGRGADEDADADADEEDFGHRAMGCKTRAPKMNEVELRQYIRLLWTHPEQYMRIAEDMVRQYPDDPTGYHDCFTAWMDWGCYELALADINSALALADQPYLHMGRGEALRCLGRYREAIEAFDRCQAMAPGSYDPFPQINRAACHARLGDLDAALAECAHIPDDHCMPGFKGAPGGTKAQITETCRKYAAEADANKKIIEECR